MLNVTDDFFLFVFTGTEFAKILTISLVIKLFHNVGSKDFGNLK